MTKIAKWMATIGLGALAVYCMFALLFTAGGRDIGGAGGSLLIWFGAIGSAVAVWYIIQSKARGRWFGIAVYGVGAVYFLYGSATSSLPSTDRIFLLMLAVANGLGAFALHLGTPKAKA